MAGWTYHTKRNQWNWILPKLTEFRPIDMKSIKTACYRLAGKNYTDYDIHLWLRNDTGMPDNRSTYFVASYAYQTKEEVAFIASMLNSEAPGPSGAKADGEDYAIIGPISGDRASVIVIQRGDTA